MMLKRAMSIMQLMGLSNPVTQQGLLGMDKELRMLVKMTPKKREWFFVVA